MNSILATSLKHIEVEQTSAEQVDYTLLEILSGVCDLTALDSTSTMKGTLVSQYAFKDSVDKLMAKFSTLVITYTYRLLRFTANQPLLSYLLANHDANNDGAIGVNEIGAIKNITLPDDVTSLSESSEFPNLLAMTPDLKTIKGGTGLAGDVNVTSNTSITSVDMSGTQTRNVVGATNKASLATLKLGKPTSVTIKNCGSLNI